jgi:hypothetical protein
MDSGSAQTTSREGSLSDVEVAYNLLRTCERIGILKVNIPNMPKSLHTTQSSQSTLDQSVKRETVNSPVLSSSFSGARPLTPSLGSVRSGESIAQDKSLFDSYDDGSVEDESEELDGAMPKRYQRAAAVIWQVATGGTLSDEALLEGKLSVIFRGAILRKSVLRLADRGHLQTFISTYRAVLVHCFPPDCVAEIDLKGKGRRGLDKTKSLQDPQAALTDLANTYQTISRFHCWFEAELAPCKGIFGSCPYKPEKVRDLDDHHLKLLADIRKILCQKHPHTDTNWKLYKVNRSTFTSLAEKYSRTGLSRERAEKLYEFVTYARVINLAIHNHIRCPGLENLPQGYNLQMENPDLISDEYEEYKELDERYLQAKRIIDYHCGTWRDRPVEEAE